MNSKLQLLCFVNSPSDEAMKIASSLMVLDQSSHTYYIVRYTYKHICFFTFVHKLKTFLDKTRWLYKSVHTYRIIRSYTEQKAHTNIHRNHIKKIKFSHRRSCKTKRVFPPTYTRSYKLVGTLF